MKLLLTSILAGAACMAHAEPGGDFTSARLQELSAFAAEAAEPEQLLRKLGSVAEASFDAEAPMPEPPGPGQSAAAADGGLFFDNLQSCLTYIGNVRLNDPRVQLRAANRLFVRLPKNEKKEEPKQDVSSRNKAADHPPTPAPQDQPEKKTEPTETLPAFITAENAAVDVPGSRILLEGRRAAPSLALHRGQDSVVLHTAASGEPAQLFSNAQGDILMLGGQMRFVWHSESGEEWALEAAQGPVYYVASERRLVAEGPARISSPRGVLQSQRSLHVIFAPPAAPAHRPANEPFAVFASMQFREVESMHAEGDVALDTPAEQDRPAAALRGDSLDYAASTGDSLMRGAPCSLTYGGYSMQAHGSIRLAENGDASIESPSSPITGSYERPLPGGKPDELIRGDFSTPGPILYSAAERRVWTPSGLSAQDAVASLSCTGEASALLMPADAPAPPRKPGMPNLAIAQMRGIISAQASGSVQLHSKATATSPAYDAEGEQLYAHIPTAELILTGSSSSRAFARYGEHELSADPTEQQASAPCIHLHPSGDITVQGGSIHAVLPGDKGPTQLTCTQSLSLQREQSLLTLGEGAHIRSPEAILTANAPLQATLFPGDKPVSAPKKYPQLAYNFSGLRRATTPGGGTLRTTQMSMQCEGAIELELKPGAQSSAADMRQSIVTAKARDRVMLAGKDTAGRLVRASGDRLDFDPASGTFYLRGSQVSLVDEFNTHTASGAGACITLDPKNNIRIRGAKQATYANRIHDQIDRYQKKK